MVPPHLHMVSSHVMCLHVLYDYYGPPYLIWNRYHMVPQHVHMVPHMYFMTLMAPHTLYGIGILWSPLPYMEQVLYDSPHVHMFPPHVKCLHVLYDSYGPTICYME